MQKYLSKTERIQIYIKEVLDDERKHSMKDIIAHVDSKLKECGEFVFQINSYVNAAMRLLMKNEDYSRISRGVYQKGGIPYISASKKAEQGSDFEKTDIRSAMVAVKAYANSFDKLYAQKPPFSEMEVNEEATYRLIKKQSLDVAKSLKENADKLFQMADAQYQNERNLIIRKYFEECLSDGNPHKMNDIKDYIFSKMIENNEYNGERSSSYIYPAISLLIVEGGAYKKVARGVYQISKEIQQTDSTYSMDDVTKILDRGCSLAEKDIRSIVTAELYNEGEIADQIASDIESSIDNVSYLIAFAEDYMDNREKIEQEEGMQGMSEM